MLKVGEINKKLLTFRNGRHFIAKKFQTAKFYERATNDWKFVIKSHNL